jgi:hypothetical protein
MKIKKTFLFLFILGLALVLKVPETRAENLTVTLGTGSIIAGNKAVVYWTTNVNAACDFGYGKESNLRDEANIAGQLIKTATADDERFYFTGQLANLTPSVNYYYRVFCNTSDGQTATSSIKVLAGYVSSADSSRIITLLGVNDVTNNSAILSFNTAVSAKCTAGYIPAGVSALDSSGNISNQLKLGAETVFAKSHKLALGSLVSATKYYYMLTCNTSDGQDNITYTTAVLTGVEVDLAGNPMPSFTTLSEAQDQRPVLTVDVPRINATSSSMNTQESNPSSEETVLKSPGQASELEMNVIDLEKKLTKFDQKFADKYAGTMFLDVANEGHLWYVDPVSKNRFYFENGAAALSIGSRLALGISSDNLKKIPIGVPEKLYGLTDADGDGLPDRLEAAIGSDPNKADTDGDGYKDGQEVSGGYSPLDTGKYSFDQNLVKRMEGRMLLQVDGENSHGEIWYIHGGKRWYGGTQDSMYEIMKARSLGATSDDIRKIEVGVVSN